MPSQNRPSCHPDRPYCAKGLCKPCYNYQPKYRPTPDQNRRRNATAATKRNKRAWHLCQGPDYAKAQHRLSRYGLTVEQYKAMWDKQAGLCRICLQPLKQDRSTHIDHDHVRGFVRGLLCKLCNNAIGFAKENERTFARMVAYLRWAGSNEPTSWLETTFVDFPPRKQATSAPEAVEVTS